MGRRISIIGGDLRQITVADFLAKDGFNVSVFGFDRKHIPKNVSAAENISGALSDSRTVILGIAPLDDKMNIKTICPSDNIPLSSLLSFAPPGCLIIGGKLPETLTGLCFGAGIGCIDYAGREDFAVLNAVPTAEGALAIAMDEMPFTLHNCSCLVTGFGRIGKILARYLHQLGAKVTCSARKSGDLAWIKSLGYNAVHTAGLSDVVHNFDIIFNTIPTCIFTSALLRNIRTGTLIIDLASKPGGVDFNAATQLGIKAIHALSLPGKCAPVTAGKIIKDTIVNILNEI